MPFCFAMRSASAKNIEWRHRTVPPVPPLGSQERALFSYVSTQPSPRAKADHARFWATIAVSACSSRYLAASRSPRRAAWTASAAHVSTI
jgi:hypothetical protein